MRPKPLFLRQRHGGVCGGGGGQVDQCQPAARKLRPPDRGRLAPVEGDRAQPGQGGDEIGERGVFGRSDRRVAAAHALRRCDRVPQRDPPCLERFEPLVVGEGRKVDADRVADKVPEAVLRVRVVSPRRERGLARQAAEDQQSRVGRGDRREGGLALAQRAASGKAGNLATSAGSCWMITVAPRFAAIVLNRSNEARVSARSVLNVGTPSLS